MKTPRLMINIRVVTEKEGESLEIQLPPDAALIFHLRFKIQQKTGIAWDEESHSNAQKLFFRGNEILSSMYKSLLSVGINSGDTVHLVEDTAHCNGPDGRTYLHKAALEHHMAEAVKVLIEAGDIDIEAKTEHSLSTALHFSRNVETSEWLIGSGAEVDARDRWGTPPIVSKMHREDWVLCMPFLMCCNLEQRNSVGDRFIDDTLRGVSSFENAEFTNKCIQLLIEHGNAITF